MSLYDTDFYAWANQQAALLKESRWQEADVGNIVEELECLARGEKRLLAERLAGCGKRLSRREGGGFPARLGKGEARYWWYLTSA